jgi:serine/threonine-protein kinase
MSFSQGEMVGPYRIIEQLGRGGMATVFKAYHANLDRYVAIKVLHPAFLEEETFQARFEREAKVVAKLEHPNIIPVYDFSEHNGNPYLVMKYVEGETLKARLKRAPLSPEEGVTVIQAVGDSLSYAHSQGILHRDVKPSNVMISEEGQIFLTDFGLARIASAGESTISNDMMIGTPQYISPEQAMGKRDLDAGTDIYSFGVLIYELVVGKVPFSADTPFAIIHDHIYTPLPLPRVVNPKVPEVLERLLLKALSKERADRFDDIDQMVAAFRKAIEGDELPDMWVDPTTYTPTPTPPPVQASAAETGTPAPAPSTPTTDGMAEAEEQPKRKWRWWYSIPIAMALCACLLVVIGILNQEPDEIANNTNRNNQQIVENDTEPIDADAFEQAIQEAIEAVEADYENPYAHLELAGLLMDSGDFEAAAEEFRIGAEFAEEDWHYQMAAGDLLFERQLWLQAVEQYLPLLDIQEALSNREFVTRFQNALYLAARNPDSQQILYGYDYQEVPRDVGPATLFAARARFELYVQEMPETAQGTLDFAFERFNVSPILRLAQAEVLIAVEEFEEAERLLNELKTGTPQWIRDQARFLLTRLP